MSLRFRLIILLATLFVLPLGLRAQTVQSANAELANLREDVRLLVQRIGELSLRVEQLENENARLAKTATSARENAATLNQLNAAIADLSRDIKTSSAQTKAEVLAVVGTQLEAMAKQTNAALDANARTRSPAPTPPPVTFSDNFPKQGTSYTVQTGDTLSKIAKKTGAKLPDIINANRITDPSKVLVGQTLFIPGGH